MYKDVHQNFPSEINEVHKVLILMFKGDDSSLNWDVHWYDVTCKRHLLQPETTNVNT